MIECDPVGGSTIREIYAKLEPPGCDTWSPLHSNLELWHRARLMVEACHALRRIPKPIDAIKALDVGCGVGRSSRLLVDLGVKPENLLGIDFRESAIAFARQQNTAIRFRSVSGLDDWPDETFDLVVQCTVFSSIPSPSFRVQTAALMERSVGKDGYVLWWDLLKANPFAGGDPLNPIDLFGTRELLYSRRVPLQPQVEESLRLLRGLSRLLTFLVNRCGHEPTHMMALFGPGNSQSNK